MLQASMACGAKRPGQPSANWFIKVANDSVIRQRELVKGFQFRLGTMR